MYGFLMVLRYCFHILLFLNYLYNFRHKNDSRPAKIKNIEKKLSNYVKQNPPVSNQFIIIYNEIIKTWEMLPFTDNK